MRWWNKSFDIFELMYTITQIRYKMSKKGQVLFCPLDGATIS